MTLVFCQKPEKQLKLAEDLFSNGNFREALVLYETNLPKIKNDISYPLKLQNYGDTQLALSDTASAINTYLEILDLDSDDYKNFVQKMSTSNMKFIRKITYKLFPNRKLSYYPIYVSKNESSEKLAKIFLTKKEYRNALHFFSLSDTVYNFQHFCGNAFISHDMYLARMYAECYMGLHEVDSALYTLAPHIFENPFETNKRIVDLTIEILQPNFNRDQYISFFRQAEKTIRIVPTPEVSYKDYDGYIQLFGRKIQIPLFRDDLDSKTEQEIKQLFINKFRDSKIYRRITSS